MESAGDRAGRSGDRAPNVSGAMAGNVSAPGRDRTGRTGRTAVGTPSTRDARGRVIVDAGRSGMARDGKGSSRGGSSHPRARRRRASLRREKSAVGPGDEGRGGIKDRGAVAHLTPSPRRPPPPSSSSSTLNASSLRNIVAIARVSSNDAPRVDTPPGLPDAQSTRAVCVDESHPFVSDVAFSTTIVGVFQVERVSSHDSSKRDSDQQTPVVSNIPRRVKPASSP